MDLKGNKNKTVLRSFQVAIEGIMLTVKEERNFRIHLAISVIVVFLSFLLALSKVEWLFIMTAIFGMLSLELVNSAIERAVNLVTNQYHPLAKAAKDMASGALFLFSIYCMIIGASIFLPKIVEAIEKARYPF